MVVLQADHVLVLGVARRHFLDVLEQSDDQLLVGFLGLAPLQYNNVGERNTTNEQARAGRQLRQSNKKERVFHDPIPFISVRLISFQ